MVKKRVLAVMVILTVLILGNSVCFAEAPYEGYNYSGMGTTNGIMDVPSPISYIPSKVITGEDLGIGSFNEPEDIFVDAKNNIFIADTKNNRIVCCDAKLKVLKVLKEFKNGDAIETLKSPAGIFVDDKGEMLIADKDNARIIICDPEGNIRKILNKPETDLLKKDFNYLPKRVLKSSNNLIYVLPANFYEGAFTYDSKGNFLGFFGSNQVEKTVGKVSDSFWKIFMTKEQREKMRRIVPSAYESFDIDEQDFIYTATLPSIMWKDQLRKLNPKGKNIMEKPGYSTEAVEYGDMFANFEESADRMKRTAFVDVAVDKDGLIFGLDIERGRVFQYDQQSNLLGIFGAIGNQVGAFRNPTAIDAMDEKVLVLDSRKCSITVFEETVYGKNIRKAVSLYRDGLYDEAIKPWQEVSSENCNLELAYVGIGKSLYQNGKYGEALKYFKLGQDRESYSESYKEYRKDYVRSHFPIIFGILSILIILLIIFSTRHTERKKSADRYSANIIDKKYKLPFYVMFHPSDGFEQLKQGNKGSIGISVFILAVMVLSSVVKYKNTGFVFNTNKPEDFDIIKTLASTIILFIVWTIANWGLCTLIEGKGKFKEIWIASSYALVPNIIITFLGVFLSNYMIKDEGAFLKILGAVGNGWTLILLIAGMLVIHQFTLKKTLTSMGLSVVGIILMLFVYVLGYSLFFQVYMFVSSIFNEIMIRL